MSWLLNDEEIEVIKADCFVKEGMKDAHDYEWGVEDEQREIAKAQNQYTIEKVVEWGNEPCDCPTRHEEFFGNPPVKRHNCFKCWQELQQLSKGE